jgi:hypothetical protein
MGTNRKVGRPRVNVPPELIQRLREEGLSFRRISQLTGFGYGSVRRAWKKIAAAQKAEGARGARKTRLL